MAQSIPVALVGLGHMGSFHLAKLLANSHVQVDYVCDRNLDLCTHFSKRNSLSVILDYKDIPTDKINAVVIATNTNSHLEITKYFLSNRVHVLLEKPMTDSVEDAKELIKLAEQNSCILQIGHVERFNPSYKRLKTNIINPRYIETKRITPFRGRGTDVNVILDLMLHDIDIVLDLVNEYPERVEAVGVPVLTQHVDMAQVRMEFPSGVVANLTVSRVANSSERTLRVFQQDACLTIDYQTRKFRHLKKAVLDGSINIECDEEVLIESDPLAKQLESFIDSITNGSKVAVDGYDGMKSIEIVDMVMDSINRANSNFTNQVI